MVELFANSGDPEQTLHSAASDLGLNCLPITLLGVSRIQWVKMIINCALLILHKNLSCGNCFTVSEFQRLP